VEARALAVDDMFRQSAIDVCNDHNFFPFLETVQVGVFHVVFVLNPWVVLSVQVPGRGDGIF
jgi:hypothetical protein